MIRVDGECVSINPRQPLVALDEFVTQMTVVTT